MTPPLGRCAKTQGLTHTDFLLLSISFTKQLAATAAAFRIPTYSVASVYPFTSVSRKNAGFRALAQANHVNESDFSASDYVTMEWLVHALKAIKGPITRASATRYFKSKAAYATPVAPALLSSGPDRNTFPSLRRRSCSSRAGAGS
ncbi:MAG: hypothetical protein ACRDVP_07340 [Acidimicrobiales bacterium]